MNKKYLVFGLMGLFAMSMVAAIVVNYYGSVSQEIIIDSPLDISELESMTLEGYLQSPQYGGEVTVENKAEFDVDVELSSIALEGGEVSTDITTSYNLMSTLELSGKSDCYAEGTCTLESLPKATVHYTVIGNEFVYEVESNDIVVNEYTLVYYPDVGGYASSDYTGDIIPADEISESLPIAEDLNGGDTSNSCDPVGSCQGAKLWLIPTNKIDFTTNKISGWDGDSYLFETDLITYTKGTWDTNPITVPARQTLDFVPVYEFGVIEGTYNIATSVTPVTA